MEGGWWKRCHRDEWRRHVAGASFEGWRWGSASFLCEFARLPVAYHPLKCKHLKTQRLYKHNRNYFASAYPFVAHTLVLSLFRWWRHHLSWSCDWTRSGCLCWQQLHPCSFLRHQLQQLLSFPPWFTKIVQILNRCNIWSIMHSVSCYMYTLAWCAHLSSSTVDTHWKCDCVACICRIPCKHFM